MLMPHPDVQVSRCRTVIGRGASTVRSSGASGVISTRGFAASGSQRAIGSSSASTSSCTRASVSAPPICFVSDAIRNSVSLRIGALACTAIRPPARTSVRRPMRTAAT